MRHSAPAREAMPQKQPRRQAKRTFAAVKIARIALKLFQKNFGLLAAKFPLRAPARGVSRAEIGGKDSSGQLFPR
jgi:hypothetical protein